MKNLGLSLILVVITAVIGLGYVITEINYRNARSNQELDGELAAYHRLGQELALTLDAFDDKQAFLDQWRAQTALRIRLQQRIDFPVPAKLSTEFQQSGSLILQANDNVSLHFLLPQSGEVLSITIPDTLSPQQRPLASLVLTLAFYASLIATLLLWLYPLFRRLLMLRRTAHSLGQGDLSVRVTTSPLSYIGDIEVEFNRMADRIQALIDDNKLLSRAVSHNLKTPLARLRFGLDTLEETRDPELRRKYTQRISRDLAEMESLVETLLQYARLDEAGVQLRKQRIELTEFVTRLFAEREKPGIEIVHDHAKGDTGIIADPNYLAMLLNNIMDNALAHARSCVKVAVAVSGGSINVDIEDDGKGIPAAERSEVIKPFWRGSEEPAGGGHGMGLAIVARIATWSDASLHIGESSALGGAAIRLRFRAAG